MTKRRVALTFDAEHPSRAPNLPDGPERILDVLQRRAVAATFFLQGRWASAYPEVASRIARAGHLIGNHSHYHAPMRMLSAEGFDADVRQAQARIADVTGADPRPWFRCPFGDGAADHRIGRRLRRLGYRTIGWDVDSLDWLPARAPQDVASAVIAGVADHAGESVVLFHTWSGATAAALPAVIQALTEHGLAFATVAELWA